ncbi:MAG TPA: FecR domain-containing protein, partial [Puia sp.]|nr:FecR domain-containing protein [Puia sp.]
DDHFIQWVISPDESSNAYWSDWMKKNPNRIDDLLRAKKIAQDLKSAQKQTDSEHLSRAIWENIHLNIEQEENVIDIAAPAYKKRNYLVAASVAAIVLIFSSAYYLLHTNNSNQIGNSAKKVENSIVKNNLEHINSTSESRIVYLVDGTKITLQPGASIRHAVFLQKDKREVYLDGDAFFEVAKDAKRPFYVYAHDIVLRVLGTSFNVTTNKANGNVTVLVKTGKVSVYKYNNQAKAEFILTPNESVRYTAQNQNIAKSESDAELSKAEMTSKHEINFNFEETPVIKIFEVLEEAYGIKIKCDEKIFSKCIITTALNDATFDDKLKIICEATNATFTVQNNEVTIDGKGCK